MTRIRWTTDAVNQLEGIVKHIQEDNPDAARKVAQILLDSIANLETFPQLGRPGEEVEGTRELVYLASAPVPGELLVYGTIPGVSRSC